jgi:hypothetical protein
MATDAASVCGISRANAGDDGENGRDQKSFHLFSSRPVHPPTVIDPTINWITTAWNKAEPIFAEQEMEVDGEVARHRR